MRKVIMSPFGFTPDDGSGENPNEMTPEQLAAMLAQMQEQVTEQFQKLGINPAGFCLLYTSPSPRDRQKSRMPSSA